MLRKYTNTKEGVTHPGKTCAASGRERSSPRSSWRPGCNWKACRSTKRPSAASRPGSGWWRIMSCSIWQRFCGCAWKTCLGWINAADMDIRRVLRGGRLCGGKGDGLCGGGEANGSITSRGPAVNFDSLPVYTPISVSSIGGFRFTRNRGGERRNLRNVHGIWANRKRNSLELPLTGHREKGIIKENGTACRICPDSGAETEVDHE